MSEENTSWRDFFIDLMSGALAGVTMITAGQPFDTIKVRMQMGPPQASVIKTVKDIYLKEGFLSYYKGITAPLVTSLPVSSSVFAAYETYMRYFEVNNREDFLLKHWVLGGCFGGFVQSFIVGPAELLKCVLQMQFEYLPKKYSNVRECLKSFYREEGIKGIFKGQVATILRDVPQYAMFFTAFETSKYLFLKRRQATEMTFWESFIAGAISGLTCIAVSYPQDFVKTKLQCEIIIPPKDREYQPIYRDGGFTSCSRAIWRQGKFPAFWVGFWSCSMYYIVTCSVQFLTYEQSKLYLTSLGQHNETY